MCSCTMRANVRVIYRISGTGMALQRLQAVAKATAGACADTAAGHGVSGGWARRGVSDGDDNLTNLQPWLPSLSCGAGRVLQRRGYSGGCGLRRFDMWRLGRRNGIGGVRRGWLVPAQLIKIGLEECQMVFRAHVLGGGIVGLWCLWL